MKPLIRASTSLLGRSHQQQQALGIHLLKCAQLSTTALSHQPSVAGALSADQSIPQPSQPQIAPTFYVSGSSGRSNWTPLTVPL